LVKTIRNLKPFAFAKGNERLSEEIDTFVYGASTTKTPKTRKHALTVAAVRARLKELADPKQAVQLKRFFKTGPGEYGEGDVFNGVKMPVLRKLVRELEALPIEGAVALLQSAIHEERMLALLLLVRRYERCRDEETRCRIYELYLANTARINNWDLVDVTVAQIVGAHLENKSRSVLYVLARSQSLWERRIAMIATHRFIRKNDFDDALRLADALLCDTEDLIHKAVGWMLREIGSRDRAALEAFLLPHYKTMPRTMLRYAIEKFEEPLRKRYLAGNV
jgi:3-methyladenine DNA glycosylase AlkD